MNIIINCVSLKDMLDIITSLVAIIGIPVGIYTYYQTKRRERLDREYETYSALDQRFIDYLHVCLEHPELDVFSTPLPDNKTKVANTAWESKRKEMIIYTMLVSIFERAYLIYRDGSSEIKTKQWDGWEKYIHDWVKKQTNFEGIWQEIGIGQFDAEFVKFINKLIKST